MDGCYLQLMRLLIDRHTEYGANVKRLCLLGGVRNNQREELEFDTRDGSKSGHEPTYATLPNSTDRQCQIRQNL